MEEALVRRRGAEREPGWAWCWTGLHVYTGHLSPLAENLQLHGCTLTHKQDHNMQQRSGVLNATIVPQKRDACFRRK